MRNYYLRTAIVLLVLCMQALAMQAQKKVTVHVTNASLRQVFKAIEGQTTYRFSYKSSIIDKRNDITINKTDEPVNVVLDAAFKGRPLKYSIVSSKSIVITERHAAGFLDPNFETIDAGAGGTYSGGGTNWKYNRASFFGRLNYNFNERYLLQVTFREDGSSKFGADSRWGFFPSVAVGWRISEEAFFPKNTVVNNLKLRASWGQLGNENALGYYDFLENGDFVRLRQLQLGYTLPSSIAGKIYCDRIRFYVSAENLFTITGYSGATPRILTRRAQQRYRQAHLPVHPFIHNRRTSNILRKQPKQRNRYEDIEIYRGHMCCPVASVLQRLPDANTSRLAHV